MLPAGTTRPESPSANDASAESEPGTRTDSEADPEPEAAPAADGARGGERSGRARRAALVVLLGLVLVGAVALFVRRRRSDAGLVPPF